jgi:hypothetical protein
MAYAGQVIENPLSGERITFHLTAAQTDGERVVIDLEVAAGGRMPAGLHVHPEPVRVEIRPALAMEPWLETAVALAREGRACANGMPKPLDLALFVREAQAAFPPPWAQRIAIAPLAWIAERRGYGPLPRRSGARLSDGSVPVVHHRRCRPSRTRRTRGEHEANSGCNAATRPWLRASGQSSARQPEWTTWRSSCGSARRACSAGRMRAPLQTDAPGAGSPRVDDSFDSYLGRYCADLAPDLTCVVDPRHAG